MDTFNDATTSLTLWDNCREIIVNTLREQYQLEDPEIKFILYKSEFYWWFDNYMDLFMRTKVKTIVERIILVAALSSADPDDQLLTDEKRYKIYDGIIEENAKQKAV